mgnify:CR=1 FL=1
MAESIIGAFSEEQAELLTGLSRAQLRSWNRSGFIRPAFGNPSAGRKAYARIYSFKDLLKLRVLNQLRNVHKIPMPELRRVEDDLEHMGDEKWTSQKLWVLNKRVVFTEPDSNRKREDSSKQFVAEIPLEVVTSCVKDEIKKLNERKPEEIGRIVKQRFRQSSAEIFAGTRVTLSAILSFIKAGYDDEKILKEYPDLSNGDIEAARRRATERVA